MEASIAIFLPKKWKINKQWVYMKRLFVKERLKQGKSMESIDIGKRNDLNKNGLCAWTQTWFSFFCMKCIFKTIRSHSQMKWLPISQRNFRWLITHNIMSRYIVKGPNTQNNGCFWRSPCHNLFQSNKLASDPLSFCQSNPKFFLKVGLKLSTTGILSVQ